MKFFLLAFLLLLTTSQALAILNVEKLRKESGDGLNGSLNMNISGQKGNTDTSTTNIKSLNAYSKNFDKYLILLDYTYGENNGVTNTHRGTTHLRYSYIKNKLLVQEFFVQSEFDDFRNLDFRQVAGLGLRTSISKLNQGELYIGYGVFYEFEKYSSANDESRVRLNSYLTYNQTLAENVEAAVILYVQPDVSDLDDLRVSFSPSLKTQISKKLSMLSSVDYRLDSKPVNDNKKYDISYNMGLIFDF